VGETLTIRNFGPIKDMTFEFGKVNVLIGEQATGKSTVVKVLAMCRYFSYITNFDYFEKEGTAFSWGLFSWGLDEYVEEETYIEYSCHHYNIIGLAVKPTYDPWVEKEIQERTYEIQIKYEAKSEEFKKLILDLKSINKESESFSFDEIPVTFFQNNVAPIMDYPIYLPVERGLQSLFSLGKSSIQNFSDALFQQLAKIDSAIRRFKDETEIQPLKVYYKNIEGRSYVRKVDSENYYSLSNGASGYQIAIPVVLIVKFYNQIKKKRKTFLIEEPELSIFPEAQQSLINFLIESVNVHHNSLWLTTHSPYTLSSINNLIYAFVAGKVNAEATSKVIAPKYWLNPDDVSTYMLLPDGTCEDIFDRKEALIDTARIDSISAILNRKFDELIDIELSVTDENN
jgi:predicted ATP-dependent endonuclease of OLD family